MYRKVASMLLIINIILICIYSVYVFSNNIAAQTNSHLVAKDMLKAEDFNISGLCLKQPITEAIKILGKPIKMVSIPNKDGFHEYDEEDYYFSDVIIRVQKADQKVIRIIIENKTIKTYRNIGIGDEEEKVYYHYGRVDKIGELGKKGDTIVYWFVVEQVPPYQGADYLIKIYYALGFVIKNGYVTKIELQYVPEE